MLIALDTSTAATVVGVAALDGHLLAEARHDPADGERPGHTTRLLELAETALSAAGADWADVQRVGVGVGPGGFTGLRAGLAAGAALAAALKVETVPVVSLDAVARGAIGDAVLAVIDARRSEVFARSYDGQGAPQSDPVVESPEAVAEAGRVAIGDGAVRYRAVLEAAGMRVPADDDRRHRVQASALTAIAAASASGQLDPLYLREPDAKPRSR